MENPFAEGFFLSLFQKFYRAWWQLDGTDTVLGLGLTHRHTTAFFSGDGAADLKSAGLLIEVLPPQTADLTSAQAGGQLRIEEV